MAGKPPRHRGRGRPLRHPPQAGGPAPRGQGQEAHHVHHQYRADALLRFLLWCPLAVEHVEGVQPQQDRVHKTVGGGGCSNGTVDLDIESVPLN